MDFLNKAYAQIAELFRSMTPGARITAGLLLAVVIVSLGYLFNSQVSGHSSDLLNGAVVSNSQLQLMMSAFGKANLNDAEVRNGQIFVPRGQEAKYMAALADSKALPPNFGSPIRDAVEGGNIFSSSEERANRLIVGKQEELKNVISQMRGISNASVILDSTTTNGLKREKLYKASVYIQPSGSQELDDEKAANIRAYVAGAVAGMKYENVTVSDQNGRTWSGSPESGGVGTADNEYAANRRNSEKLLASKIKEQLSYIAGVTVSTSVTLDPNKKTRITETVLDKKTSLDVHSVESNTSLTRDSMGTGGQAGFAANSTTNSPMALANKPVGGSKEEENGSKTETTYLPGGKQTDTEKIGMTPIKETASIGIPASYFKKAWQSENTPAGQEPKEPDAATLGQYRKQTIDKVKKQVANLLALPEGVADPTTLVEVTDFQEIPIAMPPEPSIAKNAMVWLGDYWGVLGMLCLAGVSMVMLRSMVKSVPPTEPTGMPRLADTPDEENEASTNKPKPIRIKRFTAGPSLRDEISTLVKEDPDIAANILKTWIGHVG